MTAVSSTTFTSHLLQGNISACHAYLDDEKAARAGTAEYLKDRAEVHGRASEFTQALELYIQIGNDFPNYINHRYSLVDVCAHLGLRELCLAEIDRMINRVELAPAFRQQILAEAFTPLGLDKEILALDSLGHPGELNGQIIMMMQAQSQMRLHGIGTGVDQFMQSYCTPAALRCMYPGSEVDTYWYGQKALPRSLRLTYRGGIGDSMQWFRYAVILQGLGVALDVPQWDFQRLGAYPADVETAEQLRQKGYHLDPSASAQWTDPFTLFSALFPDLSYASRDRYVGRIARDTSPLAADFRLKARGKPCVGLFWSANESPALFACRSLRLADLQSLLGMHDIHWLIFQRGHQRNEWMKDRRSEDVNNFTNVSTTLSFSECIALMDELDALVSIDSGLIHAAASMGKPTILLANQAAEWRWESQADTSPWYPHLKIARAPVLGGWQTAAKVAAEQLTVLFQGGAPAP